MAKTAAQRAARRRRKANKKANMGKIQKQPSSSQGPKRGPSSQPKKAKKKNRTSNQSLATRSSISMMSDGVNVGSVWKNTTAERVTFPVAREKISDLTSASTAFQLLQQLFVNPGNSTLFPIFSQIASCYEEYVPNHLKFIFRTEEYMASGSTVSAGLVAMGTNFDANDANFGNITQLENYEHSISGPPFSGIIVHDVVEQHRKRFKGKARDLSLNNYYVFPSANSIGPSTDQAKWYDMGNFQLAVNGCQAGVIGELWVEYGFTMIRRKQPEFPIGGTAIHLKLYADDATAASPLGLVPFTTGNATSTGVTVSGIAPGSSLSVANMAGNLALYTGTTIGLNNAATTVLNLPNVSATWLVSAYWSGATAVASVPSMTAAGGATILTNQFGGVQPLGFFLAAGTRASFVASFTSTATATPTLNTNSLTIGGLVNMTDGNLDITISRVPTSMITDNGQGKSELDELRDEVAIMRTFMKQFSSFGLLSGDRVTSSLDSPLMQVRPVQASCSSAAGSEPDTPDECKEADLERSVHISRSMASRLSRALGGK